MPRHARRRRRTWIAGAAPVVVIALVVAGWAIAGRAAHGRVARNVELAGHDVGGESRADLSRLVDQLVDGERTTPVHITTPTHAYDTTAQALGLSVDRDATVNAVMAVDHSGFAPLRPFRWLASWFATRTVRARLHVDRAATAAAPPAIQGGDRIEALEPTIGQTSPGAITVQRGTPGHGIDPDRLADALLAAAATRTPGAPLQVQVTEGDVAPRFTDAEAQAVADDATTLARKQLTLTVDGRSKVLDVPTIAAWFRAAPHDGRLALIIDPDALKFTAVALFGDSVGRAPQDASFTVLDGKPVLHPSTDGRACCDPKAPDTIMNALRSNQSAVTVGLVTQPPTLTTDEAKALGIVEEVGQPDMFGPTTHHPCCESRVVNIHKIADIVRGHVILPGDTFSVNGFVGQRTAERGFVDAPVIYNATHDHDIGGGVSQFATTMFNAAFFAGLDLPEYQSHSLVISRYPRGREATISWPAPDLKLTNSTPYGVLIWPTYDDTSLTVHLYSTHFVDVEAGPTSDSPAGQCTRVSTPRTRTYLDGHTANDKVFALYQPADGVRC